MKVAVYRAANNPAYYRALLHLEAKGAIQLEFFDHRPNALGAKLWYLWPALGRAITGKAPRQANPAWSQITANLLNPFRLLARQTVIVAFSPSIAGLYFLLLRLLGKRVIYFTSWPDWKDYRWYWRRFLQGVEAVAVTRKATDALLIAGADVRHIPHSVETKRFRPYRRFPQALRILYVGRLVSEKGVRELAEAVQELRQTHGPIHLRMIGEGPERAALEALGVACYGHVSSQADLIRHYQNSDIFVLNSYEVRGWQELFGISLIEAMACGLPCIATNCVGPREIMQHHRTGYLVFQKDSALLKYRLQSLLKSADLREQFGRNGRQEALRYSVPKMAEKWRHMLNVERRES